MSPVIIMKILLISGSPREGNCEAVLKKIKKIISTIKQEKNIETELILLREKNIHHCEGCVEFCNSTPKCKHTDDTNTLLEKFESADAIVIASPTYFSMPSGLLKDFIDKTSVIWTKNVYSKKVDMSNIRGAVIGIGTHLPSIEKNSKNIEEVFKIFKIPVVKTLNLLGVSELKDKDNILKEKENPTLIKDLEDLVEKLIK